MLPTSMATASKIAGDLKIVTDLIVFLYSFSSLAVRFIFRNQLINTKDSKSGTDRGRGSL